MNRACQYGCILLMICGLSLIADTAYSTSHNNSIDNSTPLAVYQDSIPSPWDKIQLTGRQMKPGLFPTALEKNPWLSPWYIVGGAAIIAGSAVLLIMDGNDLPSLQLMDDSYVLNCGMPVTIDVLSNDKGEGLRVTSVSSTNSSPVILNERQIYIEELNAQYIIINYEVTDASGNMASAELRLTVVFPPLNTMYDIYEIQLGGILSGNILQNDLGEGIFVSQHSLPAMGELQLSEDGQFTFVPDEGFTGQTSFEYTVRDICDQTSSATVLINIKDSVCHFETQISVQPAHCGLNDGSAQIVIEPAGNYMVRWEDGNQSLFRDDLPNGAYIVEVTDSAECRKSYTLQINELPPSYMITSSTIPGNCVDQGEITLDWNNPGQGPLVIRVDYKGESRQFGIPQESPIQLSGLMPILPGSYTIGLYDKNAGEECIEIIEIVVDDNTPQLHAVNDSFITPFESPLNGNFLDNDHGLQPKLMHVGNISNGGLNTDSSGFFVFTPEDNFSGTLTFQYIIEDACGNKDTATVWIEVGNTDCELNAEFEVTPASCGLPDGSVILSIQPMGNYVYTWSNGEDGNFLDQIFSGTYQLTVEDLDKPCIQTFEVFVDENDPSYILDTTIAHAHCGAQGEILLNLFSQAGPPFFIELDYPGGNEQFIHNSNGVLAFSDKIELVPGTYEFTIRNINLPPRCAEQLRLTLQSSAKPEIFLEAVIPPSSPTANDGKIIFVIEPPTTPPYQVFINEVPDRITSQQTIHLQELAAGEYLIYIQDANGCESNILEVILQPDNMLRIETITTSSINSLGLAVSRDYGSMLSIQFAQGIGVEYILKNKPLHPFLQFQIAHVQYANYNDQVFTLGYGWERSFNFKKFSITPRILIQTQTAFTENYCISHLIDNLMILGDINLHCELSKRWGIFNRSSYSPSSPFVPSFNIGIYCLSSLQ